ncbi:hypothetical protein CPB85DRAFT_157707 [Mucidula mucida]|nr:hypothetical protein CPB85DRAFT_157707 [Mucidula mucida]
MFASRHEILHDPPWYVFSKRMVAGKARWEYCGSYETTNVGNIDAEEFKGFPRNTRWGGLISESMSRTQPVYVKMRVRIGLRKLRETVTESRVDREADIIFESKKGERKGVQVTSEDVIRALSAGEEQPNILRMRCVGYDHAFVDDLKRDIEANAPDVGPAKKKQRESIKESTEELEGVSSQEQVSGVGRSNRERKPRIMAHDEEMSEDDW